MRSEALNLHGFKDTVHTKHYQNDLMVFGLSDL